MTTRTIFQVSTPPHLTGNEDRCVGLILERKECVTKKSNLAKPAYKTGRMQPASFVTHKINYQSFCYGPIKYYLGLYAPMVQFLHSPHTSNHDIFPPRLHNVTGSFIHLPQVPQWTPGKVTSRIPI